VSASEPEFKGSSWSMRLADRAYVLNTGHVVASGPSASLAGHERLGGSYLGSGVETRT